jgi:hypothetical protein
VQVMVVEICAPVEPRNVLRQALYHFDAHVQ